MDHELDPPLERIVNIVHVIGGQKSQTAVILQLLEKMGRLRIGVPVIGILHLGPFGEHGIRLVKKQDGVQVSGPAEEGGNVLFRLPDVFAHHLGQVDAVQVQSQLIGHHLDGHGLPRPRGTIEKRTDPPAIRGLSVEAPFLAHHIPVPHLVADHLHLPPLFLVCHQILPAKNRIDQGGVPAQLVHGLLLDRLFQALRGNPGLPLPGPHHIRPDQGLPYPSGRQDVLIRKKRQIRPLFQRKLLPKSPPQDQPLPDGKHGELYGHEMQRIPGQIAGPVLTHPDKSPQLSGEDFQHPIQILRKLADAPRLLHIFLLVLPYSRLHKA